VTAWPNAAVSRSASAALRTLPNTWKPRFVSTWATAQPIPVDTPVTTTDFLVWPLMVSLPFGLEGA
jgi:hypothetical protein